ncbi:hypothetical protein KAW18_16015 [candidate division WOR-3 bacterium]|nr:hypothetical protein [candidate division WOR-3 bacterium]MCK4528875.1 hypothetical protein [candidate division WOR-3 bacterium]
MKKEFAKQIYSYVVCVICVATGIIYLCVGIYGVVKIASPEFTMQQWEWEQIATFQSFKTDWEKTEGSPVLTDEELRIRWQDKREIAIMGEKRSGMQNLINMLICFVVIIPLFIIHWRLGRKLREE